jgi:DeoR/GlpR family transcriptional regulator of sugar metabolism
LGRINRTYGGAVLSTSFEPALAERLTINVAERQAIAQAAVAGIGAMSALLLGGGATMVQFARALCAVDHRLMVITPAYGIAKELATNPLIEVMLLPGLFDGQEGLVCGQETIRALERYHVQAAIIGASGVNAEGVSEAMLGAGEVYAAMLQRAEQGVVLADSGKFDKRALVLLGSWSARMTLITDRKPVGALETSLSEAGATVIVARSGAQATDKA